MTGNIEDLNEESSSEGRINGGTEVGAINSIYLDLAISEIFYFKHNVRASLIAILIGNPDDDDNIGDAILCLS